MAAASDAAKVLDGSSAGVTSGSSSWEMSSSSILTSETVHVTRSK